MLRSELKLIDLKMRGSKPNRRLESERELKNGRGRIVRERRKLALKLPVTTFKTSCSRQ